MNLTKIRKERNKTQIQVARDLKIDPTTLCNYEKGKCEPNIETLSNLADYYHTTIDNLVGRETDLINLNTLESRDRRLIEDILSMNELQKIKTEAYFIGLLGK